ncbi:MAG: FeoB-associated Cys-rich membrane protein [Fusobacteria bacterium]|jgi:hypothetical protein|nr:FeoB-associated Cys-rich membrane protein [Fusobacteriota bacterium]
MLKTIIVLAIVIAISIYAGWGFYKKFFKKGGGHCGGCGYAGKCKIKK